MRILQVLPSLDYRYGGPIRTAIDFALRSLPKNHRHHLVGCAPSLLPDCDLPAENITVLRRRDAAGYYYAPDLPSWLKANLAAFDGVVIHGLWTYTSLSASRRCIEGRIPFVCIPHGMLDPWSVFGQGLGIAFKKQIYWWLRERRMIDAASGIIFTTDRERRLAEQLYPSVAGRGTVLPYVVETPRPEVAGESQRALRFDPGCKFVLFLGRLHPKKNVHFLLDVWAAANIGPGWQLVIAGSGDNEHVTGLRAHAARCPDPANIVFTGPVSGPEKSHLLRSANWFVLPSFQENFAIAALEAIRHGCPVVLSPGVYIGDMLPVGTPIIPLELPKWVAFMTCEMQDETFRKAVIDRAVYDTTTQFDPDALCERWLSYLGSCFRKGPSTTEPRSQATVGSRFLSRPASVR